jgi:hypothetical protein
MDQQASAAIMQIRQCGGQNNQQVDNPHPAGEVDWREDMFQKITSLKDAHWSDLVEYGRAMRSCVLKMRADGEQATQYRYAQHIIERIKNVLNFLQIQKANIPEAAKDQLDKCQNIIRDLVSAYEVVKARRAEKNNARCQPQICREPPQAVNSGGAADNSQQSHHEQHAAEAISHSSQDSPSGAPLTREENHTNSFAGDNTVQGEVESPAVAVNLPGDTAEQIQQRHPADDVIPQITQSVELAGTSPAQQQTHTAQTVQVEAEDDSVHVEAERPVNMEALIKRGVNALRSLSPPALHSLASDMGVNLKRAFPHMMPDTMEDNSCPRFIDGSNGENSYKRQKVHDGTLLDEIRATYNMLVKTEIRISEDGTGGADGTLIEFCYNAVSLTPGLQAAICASELSTKLLVPADYPQSSPVILSEGKTGVPGVVDMAFRRALGLLPEPRSVKEMAKVWDSVVRTSVAQFAHRLGGGPFSRRYGGWESCIPL